MSTLWTPDGERPVGRRDPTPPPSDPPATAGPSSPWSPDSGDEPLTDAEMAAQMAELKEQLASTPAAVVVANHAYSLFELAALHLSLRPPQLDQARVAIDALGALVEGMVGRLGEAEPQLNDGLGQLRLAFVQIRTAAETARTPAPDASPEPNASPEPDANRDPEPDANRDPEPDANRDPEPDAGAD